MALSPKERKDRYDAHQRLKKKLGDRLASFIKWMDVREGQFTEAELKEIQELKKQAWMLYPEPKKQTVGNRVRSPKGQFIKGE